MRINADFARPALVRHGEATWTPSPMPGVERVMLDRVGDEVARATSLVRYAAESRFDSHTHDRGEEFLVLEGTFSDAQGDYGPGTYVRNPPGSAHAPWSAAGCTIFVKLRQFDDADRTPVVIDSSAPNAVWTPEAPGISRLPLHRFGTETVRLLRFDEAGEAETGGAGGLEVFVLDGDAEANGTRLGRWDWLRLPHSGEIRLAGRAGTRLYVKTGHLAVPKTRAKSDG